MPTYNQSECLEPTLAALAGQTVGPEQFEVIVVDDASVQDIQAVVRAVHLDLWRMLTPIDLSALIMDSLRIADTALPVLSKDVRRDPAAGIGMIDDLDYLVSMIEPRHAAAIGYEDTEMAVVRLERR